MHLYTKRNVLFAALALAVLLFLIPPYTNGQFGFIMDPPRPGGLLPPGSSYSWPEIDLLRLALLLAVVGIAGGVLYWKAPRGGDG